MTSEDNLAMTGKADELNLSAWNNRVSDSNLAFLQSQEAIAISSSINYTKGRAQGLRTSAFCLIRLSRYEAALPLLEEARILFEQLKDNAGKSDLLEYHGIISRAIGDYAASLDYLFESLDLRQKENYAEGEALSLYHLGVTYRYLGHLEKALEYLLNCLAISRKISAWIGESYSLNIIGGIYHELGDYKNALDYYNQSLTIRRTTGDRWGEAGCLDNIGNIHFSLGEYEKALSFYNKTLDISSSIGDKKGQANALFHLAKIHISKNNLDTALNFARQSLKIREELKDKKGQAELYLCMAEITRSPDVEAELDFLNKALLMGNETHALDLLCSIHKNLYECYKRDNDPALALTHLEEFYTLESQVHSNALKEKISNLETTHRIEQSRKETEILKIRNNELAALYEEIKEQKDEIEGQKKIVEDALTNLKEMQAQVIQSEKMASLGELTAGIAHEIQNPLNFVNNFSEVNAELIAEMKEKIAASQFADAIEIADAICDNENKIIHHGKRADAIVKGMLQHSRNSNEIKEPTDINALADEYLRLAYHGLRARDKSFNATVKTDFDKNIGKINVIQQDIGRVVLNLLNNAFYSVREKATKFVASGQTDYCPTVAISTKKNSNSIEIKVEDTGSGIPQSFLEKIFQPFFTTKPTGQGTGLGLSLSYDIITKGHGGSLRVETIEGEGSAFIISLPVEQNTKRTAQ